MYQRFKVLIVDDEKDLCDLVTFILKDINVEISCVGSLQKGKSVWEQEFPPIVLLDNNLPDGIGVEMIESNPQLLENCKIIMVTSDQTNTTRQRAENAGIHYFIKKPFSLKKIRDLVNQIFLKNDRFIIASQSSAIEKRS